MTKGRRSNAQVAQDILKAMEVVAYLSEEKDPVDDDEYGEVIQLELSEVADSLGTTLSKTRKLIEQVTVVRFDGHGPGFFLEDDRIVVWGELPETGRTVRLTQAEAAALITAMDLAGMDHGDQLRSKLIHAVAPPDLESVSRAINIATSQALGPLIQTLTLAIQSNHPVGICHMKTGASRSSSRVIEPYWLLIHHGIWYVEAYCRSSCEMRIFRLDRIERWSLIEYETFEQEDSERSYSPIHFEDAPRAELLVHSRSLIDELDWPGAKIEDMDDLPLRVQIPYQGTGWITQRVISCLGDVEVVAPQDLRTVIQRRAAEMMDSELGKMGSLEK